MKPHHHAAQAAGDVGAPAHDERFARQASAFALRATCEACAHYVVEREACAHEYPNHAHRDVARTTGTFVFCKEFELR